MPAERALVSNDCPDENVLGAYVEARLASDDVARVEAHLDGCAACHRLAALIAGEGSGEMRSSDAAKAPAGRKARWLAPGTALGRYIVARPIGEGGMGVVYVAYDQELRREVALKVVSSADDSAMRLRLVREGQIAARLQHPNVVSIYDVGESDGVAFLAMELIRGRSLRARLREESASLTRRVGWLLDVARALAAAHGQGLVHRDIKPENVMVGDDGAVKVVDFGIARPAQIDAAVPANESVITADGALIGTPVYMAPEQLRGGTIEPRTDQFAWGVLAYELLVGARPWTGHGYALASAILTAELPPFPAHVPRALQDVIRRTVAKDPKGRFSSMSEVVTCLTSLRTSSSGVAWGAGGHARTMLAGGALAIVGAAIAVAVVASNRQQGGAADRTGSVARDRMVLPAIAPATADTTLRTPDQVSLPPDPVSIPQAPQALKAARQGLRPPVAVPRAVPSVDPFDIRK